MEWLCLLIPILVCGGFFLIGIKLGWIDEEIKDTWLGISGVMLFICALLIGGMSYGMRSGNFRDTEYLSYYYTKVRHTDRWNEYIHRTCTEEVAVGRDEDGNTIYETREYDCSYVEDHPERWIKYDSRGHQEYIDRDEFDRLRRLWHAKEVFVDMHRSYHTIDGDAQDYYWCEDWWHIKTYTREHPYENRIAGSNSVLKFREITPEEAKELGLHDYPAIIGGEQNPLVGFKGVGEGIIKKFQYINAYYGASRQIQVFVLAFPESLGAQVTEDQKAYWQGGNKNELVICVGLGSNGRKIHWANCFSWQDNIEMDVRCRQWLMDQGDLDLMALGRWIERNLGMWKRKEFKDYDYIKSYLTADQVEAIVWTVVVMTLIGLVVGIVIIFKENV